MITRARILVPVAILTAGCLFAQNFKIVNANSGEVLAIAGPNTSNGTPINQTNWSAWSNQQWQILPLGNGYSRIVSPYDGKVLDVTGVSTANGALIQQYDWLGWANQQWQVVPQGSSYNSIVNLNSGKVLDVQGASTTQGALVQQWDWLNGLNQQWEVVPVQDTYRITAMTSVYYQPPYVFAVGTTDADYSTQYYYGNVISTQLFDNGAVVRTSQWGLQSGQAGWGATDAAATAIPGHYYEGTSWFKVAMGYTEQQVVVNCGAYCSQWYDPFDYSFVQANPEGTDDSLSPVISFGSVIALIVAIVSKVISLGQNGGGVSVPGNKTVFDLKFRAFIPPAWVRGPDPCYVVGRFAGGTIYGGDNRNYDPFSTSFRAASEGIVSSSTGGWVSLSQPNPSYLAGVTQRYGSDALAADGYTLYTDTVFHDCYYTDDSFQEDKSQMAGSVKGGSGSVTTNFNGTVQDLASDLYVATPGLGYNVTYTINSAANPVTPAYTFEYSHKCYPAYEAYIGTQRIYGYLPTHHDPISVGLCLAGSLVVSNATIGSVN